MLKNTTILTVLASLILLPTLISLGTWQLNRAQLKKQIMTDYAKRLNSSPLKQLPSEFSFSKLDLEFYPIEIEGHFLNDRSLYIDNRSFQGKPGVEVITPFVSKEGKPAILVDRGWLPYGKNRQDLPAPPQIKGTKKIHGLLKRPTQTLSLGNQEEPSTGWPRVIQNLYINKASQMLNLPLQNYILMLKSDSPYACKVTWTPVTVTADRHIAYAVQWYALAIAWIITAYLILFRRGCR